MPVLREGGLIAVEVLCEVCGIRLAGRTSEACTPHLQYGVQSAISEIVVLQVMDNHHHAPHQPG